MQFRHIWEHSHLPLGMLSFKEKEFSFFWKDLCGYETKDEHTKRINMKAKERWVLGPSSTR